jgi:NAD(P)H-dependent FMN reductase
MDDDGPDGRVVRVLALSGSLRGGSTNSAMVRTVRAVAPAGVEVDVYEGMADLPHFNPDDDYHPLPAAVADLRARIAAADALLISTPEYAGALPGSFKNLLDWTVGGTEVGGRAVGWINVSTSPTGAADAHASLRTVLGYVGADVIEAACVHIPVPRDAIAPDGLITDPTLRHQVASTLRTLTTRPD